AGDGDISGPYTPKKNVYHAGETANMGAGNWGQQSSGINYHFIRYADVLLMAAEAAVETNDLGTALNYVNQVRARAKSSTPVSNDGGATPAANYDIELYTAADFGSQGAARDRVRMERRLELAMEGHRLFDIRRWSEGVQIMNDYFANEARTIPNFAGKANAMQDKHRLFPIPIGAIDVSAGALTQNPNW
ncbi:MAG: RagB/SusD family nutrient uptake outer membrane protein, partial [Lutibacter sp.]|nr:RagB/SusD family nutrient uptake outer membrane protein [Lutibacter sp.]